ncbi:MAG: hypothetical protein J6Y78_11030 [Paludibacteraceae bacterium]|nr:hypothetical protein [Paludibacteraceae bacterium]
MVDVSITGFVTWLRNWFYTKQEIDDNKQDKLVPGINLKTINNNSLLGVGNINISGGSSGSALACVSDFDVDSTDLDNIELYIDACQGKVIESISKTSVGLVDTYTITYDNEDTYQFTVTNGSDATVTYTPTVTSSTTGAYKIGEINGTSIYGKDTDTHQSLTNYIQKSNTSGLVKNDGTIDTSAYLTEHQSLANYVQKETGKGLFSGSYSDLTNKPSFTPTVTSSTTGAYKIGSINISGSSVDIYGKDTGGSGGSGSVIGTGSFSIDNNGHLIVELPDGVDNPYFINNSGHLVYDTSNAYNSGLIE